MLDLRCPLFREIHIVWSGETPLTTVVWYAHLLPDKLLKHDTLRCGSHVMSASYQSILTLEPGKRSGKPTIRGMRITVYDVLSYLAAGVTHQEILNDFPYLTEEDIRACLSYAADRENQLLTLGA